MKKFKCFSVVDLTVIIGLILVLSGASLVMFGKVSKSSRDSERIASANTVFDAMQSYYKSNFHSYPIPSGLEATSGYQSVVIGGDNDVFLQIGLGDKVTNLKPESEPNYGFVYVYSNDGQEAAIVVRRLESGTSKCNVNSGALPTIIKDYLTKDPSACYFKASSEI